MSKTYRLGVVLLAAASVVVTSNSQIALGQRNVTGGGSNASNNDNKDQDEDDGRDNRKRDRDKDDESNQGNENNQGGNSSNSGNSKKSGNSNVPQFQPFIQRGKNQKDQDKDDDEVPNNQGPGGFNKVFGPNQPGFPGKFSPSQQPVIVPGGSAEPVNKKLGSWKGDKWEGTRKIDNWTKVFGNSQQPFSSQWYKDHPQAWKYDNNKSNVWVVATVPGVYSWLGWGNVPPQYGVNFGNVERFDPTRYGDWYPLGVFSLMTGPDDVGTRVVQLAVDRHGHIAGNYFDMITNANHGISGEVDPQSQRGMVVEQKPIRPVSRKHHPADAAVRHNHRTPSGRRAALAVRAIGELTGVEFANSQHSPAILAGFLFGCHDTTLRTASRRIACHKSSTVRHSRYTTSAGSRVWSSNRRKPLLSPIHSIVLGTHLFGEMSML